MEFLTRVSIHRHTNLHCQVVECIAPTVNQMRENYSHKTLIFTMLSLQHDRLKATCQNEYWDPW